MQAGTGAATSQPHARDIENCSFLLTRQPGKGTRRHKAYQGILCVGISCPFPAFNPCLANCAICENRFCTQTSLYTILHMPSGPAFLSRCAPITSSSSSCEYNTHRHTTSSLCPGLHSFHRLYIGRSPPAIRRTSDVLNWKSIDRQPVLCSFRSHFCIFSTSGCCGTWAVHSFHPSVGFVVPSFTLHSCYPRTRLHRSFLFLHSVLYCLFTKHPLPNLGLSLFRESSWATRRGPNRERNRESRNNTVILICCARLRARSPLGF